MSSEGLELVFIVSFVQVTVPGNILQQEEALTLSLGSILDHRATSVMTEITSPILMIHLHFMTLDSMKRLLRNTRASTLLLFSKRDHWTFQFPNLLLSPFHRITCQILAT